MTRLTQFAVERQSDLDFALAPPVADQLHPWAIELQGALTCPPGWRVADLWFQAGHQRVGGLQAAVRPAASAALAGATRYLLRGALGLLGLPAAAGVELRLRLAGPDGASDERLLARLAWERAPLAAAPPGLQPLLCWIVGRSGSTAVMQWLAQHPELVTLPDYPFEGRLAQYQVNRLAVAAQPNDPWHPQGGNALEEDWHATPRPPLLGAVGSNRQTPRPRLMAYLAGPAVQDLAALTTAQIAASYAALAGDLGRPNPRYFVEKFQPAFVATLTCELYPAARHLFLVRDPRDTLLSWQRYFPTDLDAAQLRDEFADKQLGPHLTAWERRRDAALLLRYEDFVADPAATMAAVFRPLGLAATPALLERLAAEIAAQPLPAGHATSPSAAASVGRWRQQPADWRQAATARFADYLAAFGYPAAT